jgi:hypothetical protein
MPRHEPGQATTVSELVHAAKGVFSSSAIKDPGQATTVSELAHLAKGVFSSSVVKIKKNFEGILLI